MNTPAVEIRGLVKRYPLTWKRKVLVAVDQLDLTVKPGEVFGLLGPNGSGKSTTMKCLLGLVRPTAGHLKIFGAEAHTLEARKRLGFLPENPYFYKFLNADETLKFYGELCGVHGPLLKKRIDELIELVGLQRGRERPLGTYSKGMLQRIGLAQALIHDPELVLLDEPTAGVDPVGSRDIRDLILELKARGKTIIFSSHLLEQVEEVADRVAIIYLGKKVLEGTLNDLLTIQTKTVATAEGLGVEDEAALRDWLSARGAREVTIEKPKRSLEQLFLETVEARK